MKTRVAYRQRSRVAFTALFLAASLLEAAAPDHRVADAARRNETSTARVLLEQGAHVNGALGDGMTAIHWAAEHGNAQLAALLIQAGADVSATTRLGRYTPLHISSRAGHASVVGALLAAGAEANAATTTGDATPLHFAAASGSGEAVAQLLDYGARIDARETRWGQTPLMFAAANNRSAAMEILIRRGADIASTAKVLDLPAREAEDRASERRRSQRTATPAAEDPPPATRRPAEGSAPNPAERVTPPEVIDPLSYADLVYAYGGHTALLLAVREGHAESALALLAAGADINQVSAGDRTSPLLMAVINGHFDLAKTLLARGADPNLESDAGAAPLYAALNTHWIPKSRHPQPTDYQQQQTTYLELMEALLRAGADPNRRLKKSLWYDTYGDDYLGVDRMGATPFWRAAYATDVEAMRLLVSHGADPNVPTLKPPERRRGDQKSETDPSGLPPVPVGGPGVWPIHAASGVGYGQGYAGNVHRHVPGGWLPAVRYLVEEHGADVNARDHNGYTPVHHAAARGDNELILYLVGKGADVTAVSRRGQTTADMANGPVQRILPFPETVALLEKLGSKNNHRCVSC